MDFISTLEYFGLTRETVTPLVVLGVIVLFAVFRHTKPIRNSLTDIRERFVVVESRVGDLWKDNLAPASSPRQLNERGRHILETSKVDSILAPFKEEIVNAVMEKEPKTAYDAERCLLEIVRHIPKTHPELLTVLKDGAFQSGTNIDTLLFVGGIDLRNKVFAEIGFSLEQI